VCKGLSWGCVSDTTTPCSICYQAMLDLPTYNGGGELSDCLPLALLPPVEYTSPPAPSFCSPEYQRNDSQQRCMWLLLPHFVSDESAKAAIEKVSEVPPGLPGPIQPSFPTYAAEPDPVHQSSSP
jgi:hypothetical protein